MSSLYLIDRLIHKPVCVTGAPEGEYTPGMMIIYKDEDGSEMVGENLGYEIETEKSCSFISALTGNELERFTQHQAKADELYKIFVEEFGNEFKESVPLCARMNLQGNQVYFYFYAETRFNFSTFVRSFREKVGCKFFLYQVGARDRVRLHPNKHERFDPSGLPLMYSIFRHPLDTVDSEAISLQNLEGRNPERLKDRSGKLDHTLNFEKDLYKEESGKYPQRGEIVDRYGTPMKCMGSNILTQEIKLRGAKEEGSKRFLGERKSVTLQEYIASQRKNSSPTTTNHD